MRTQGGESVELPSTASGRGSRRRLWLRVAGIACLLAAAAVGGYLAWQLWGTGLYTQRVQTELRHGFEQKIDTRDPKEAPPPTKTVRVPGNAVAIIQIPRIDLDMVVVEGTDTASLRKGPGHYEETAYPWADTGRVGIAGHRTTYLHPFYNLDEMRVGDPILLRTEYGSFRYRVTRVFITTPNDVSVLDQTAKPTLVLTTCNPRYSASQRLIVFANRVI